MDTDQEWEELGKRDPYYAVITADIFRSAHLTEQSKSEFFQTGEEVVDHFFAAIHEKLDPAFAPHRGLDFGCGVGRLTVPLSRRTDEVIAVDVSPSMLAEAGNNCRDHGATNVQFALYAQPFELPSAEFDLVLNYLVLQHVPVERGEKIFARLLDCLVPGGIGVIHVSYASNRSWLREWGYRLKVRLPFVKALVNLYHRRPLDTPQMQMNNYDLNRLFGMLQRQHIRETYLEFTDHVGNRGVVLYFQKPRRVL